MKHNLFLVIVLFFIACSQTKISSPSVSKEFITERRGAFNYIAYKDTFTLEILSFIKNNTYCYTEGIPYALIIGHPINKKDLPTTISVLARCDNNTYSVGEKLRILPVENPEIPSLHKITFIKDTIINNQSMHWEIGSEFQAMWGQVLQRHL